MTRSILTEPGYRSDIWRAPEGAAITPPPPAPEPLTRSQRAVVEAALADMEDASADLRKLLGRKA